MTPNRACSQCVRSRHQVNASRSCRCSRSSSCVRSASLASTWPGGAPGRLRRLQDRRAVPLQRSQGSLQRAPRRGQCRGRGRLQQPALQRPCLFHQPGDAQRAGNAAQLVQARRQGVPGAFVVGQGPSSPSAQSPNSVSKRRSDFSHRSRSPPSRCAACTVSTPGICGQAACAAWSRCGRWAAGRMRRPPCARSRAPCAPGVRGPAVW